MNTQAKPSKVVHILLWIGQALLAAIFIMGGTTVLLQPIEAIASQMSFVNHFPYLVVKLIGLCEIVGGIGLILPSLLKIKPILTPIAAGLLALVMLFAVIYHLTHNEAAGSGFPLALGVIAGLVSWGRLKVAPIPGR